MRRLLRWVVGVVVVQGLPIAALAWLLDDFEVGDLRSVVLVALTITGLQALLWPLIYRFSIRWWPLLFPILTMLASGAIVLLAARLLDGEGVAVRGLGTGILIALGLTAGATLLGAIFSLDDDAAYARFVTAPLRRRRATLPPETPPGFLFVQLDGLPEPVLRAALAGGWMPTLRRWVEGGSHRIVPWEPDLSSQTAASQAGILLGDNGDIPAFRWYDKQAGALMVSSKMTTARALERRLSTGNGLLAAGGASRWNVFSGDAPDCLCTYSTVTDRSRRKSAGYFAYFSDPYLLARTITLFGVDVVREWFQALRQRLRNETPRIRRGFAFSFKRAATTTLMQEAGLFMLISDAFRGTPAVYGTFFGYDVLAHQAGIARADVFQVLRTLDHALDHLERAVAGAPRPYHLVVLSDHGMSQGATFRQRYEQTLADLVRTLLDEPGLRVANVAHDAEGWGNLEVAVTQALQQDTRTARLARRALEAAGRGGGDTAAIRDEAGRAAEAAVAASDVVVLASGNLGLISFKRWPERATYEQLVDAFPGFLAGLVRHPGIGFVLVRSESDGGLAIGAKGIRYLDHGYADGTDPLLPFGANAARHLSRTDGFANAPDILVMSAVDPESGEVPAFEEQVASHGGLGGSQTAPFLLYPARFDPGPTPIVGAAALHDVLKRWVNETQGRVATVSISEAEGVTAKS